MAVSSGPSNRRRRHRAPMRDGAVEVREKWIGKSKRKFAIVGDEHLSVR